MHLESLSHLSAKAEVRTSPIHGRGLFAIAEFQPGEIVCVKGGHIFTREKLAEVAPVLGPAEIQIADNLYIGPLDPAEREGAMIFSNHSCDPNIAVQGQIVFVALRQIAAGEELTHDWATTDDDDYTLECPLRLADLSRRHHRQGLAETRTTAQVPWILLVVSAAQDR